MQAKPGARPAPPGQTAQMVQDPKTQQPGMQPTNISQLHGQQLQMASQPQMLNPQAQGVPPQQAMQTQPMTQAQLQQPIPQPMMTSQPQLMTSQPQMISSQTQMISSQPQMMTSQTQMMTSQTQMMTSPPQMMTSQHQMISAQHATPQQRMGTQQQPSQMPPQPMSSQMSQQQMSTAPPQVMTSQMQQAMAPRPPTSTPQYYQVLLKYKYKFYNINNTELPLFSKIHKWVPLLHKCNKICHSNNQITIQLTG